MRDLMPAEITAAALPLIAKAIDEGGLESFEFKLLKNEKLLTYEARIMVSGEDEVVILSRT